MLKEVRTRDGVTVRCRVRRRQRIAWDLVWEAAKMIGAFLLMAAMYFAMYIFFGGE